MNITRLAPIFRFAYGLLLYLALPFVLLRLGWRARRQPQYAQHMGERFGFYHGDSVPQPLIWLHAVSVGETRAAEPLVQALRTKYPGHQILLTHMTPTGRDAGLSLFGNDVRRCYLPYDYSGAVRRFLDHFRPQIGLLMETEIWPNLVHTCKARGVPLTRVAGPASAVLLHERKLVLVRPDGHVAWRGDDGPADPLAVIDRIRGS